MDNQEIFDKVLTHLRKQGKPAIAGTSCRYRAPGGLMCAVGCLIPDNLYDDEWEYIGVGYGGPIDDILISLGMGDLSFVGALQTVHDVAERGPNWMLDVERRMKSLSLDFGLEYSHE